MAYWTTILLEMKEIVINEDWNSCTFQGKEVNVHDEHLN